MEIKKIIYSKITAPEKYIIEGYRTGEKIVLISGFHGDLFDYGWRPNYEKIKKYQITILLK